MRTLQCTTIEANIDIGEDHTLTAVGNNHLFHVGGQRVLRGKYGGFEVSNKVHAFDVEYEEWRKKESLPVQFSARSSGGGGGGGGGGKREKSHH